MDRGDIHIPAGTLEDDPEIRPQRHIFVDFKAVWFDITDGLPRFATKYPITQPPGRIHSLGARLA
jgi:hypothetical protein